MGEMLLHEKQQPLDCKKIRVAQASHPESLQTGCG
jgi:hypothetical protein